MKCFLYLMDGWVYSYLNACQSISSAPFSIQRKPKTFHKFFNKFAFLFTRSYLSWANSACSSMYWSNISFCSFVTLLVISSIIILKVKEIKVKNVNFKCISNCLPFRGSKFSLLKILSLGDHKQLFIAYRMQNWKILEMNGKR